MSNTTQVELTDAEIALIKEALQYSKHNRENYPHYESYEFKRKQVAEIEALIEKFCGL